MRVCTGREKRQPSVLILTAHLALLEGDCRWRLELSEMRAHAAHEAPPSLCLFSCMCYLSGNVQITKIVSFLHCYTADGVVLCHTWADLLSRSYQKSIANCQLAGRCSNLTPFAGDHEHFPITQCFWLKRVSVHVQYFFRGRD